MEKMRAWWVAVLIAVGGCRATEAAPSHRDPVVAPVVVTSAAVPAPPPVRAVYPWGPKATDRLDVRFAPPEAFTRVVVGEGSFGDFLRTMPLLPDGAPVVDFRGQRLHDD